MKKLIFPLLIILSLSACAPQPITDTRFLLDTFCTITIYDSRDTTVLENAFAACEYYESIFSRTLSESDISRINNAQSQPVTVSKHTIELLTKAIEFAKSSGGLFDPSIGAASSLWHFDQPAALPEPYELQAAISTIGYENISIEGDTVRIQPGMQLDLGGIAKGYIADRIAELLSAAGVQRAIIDLGGNVITMGEKAKNTPWNVGIQQPFAQWQQVIGVIAVSDMSVVTSGIYERGFSLDGTYYHHILDPRTGYPAESDLQAVTIISKTSVEGDGLSTTCFLLGLEKAKAMIEALPDTEGIFITTDYELHYTEGIGKTIPFTPNKIENR